MIDAMTLTKLTVENYSNTMKAYYDSIYHNYNLRK